jgi:hypothetical protein
MSLIPKSRFTPAVALLGVTVLSTAPAVAQQVALPSAWQPAAQEVARLPTYCRAQFYPDSADSSLKSPVQICGVYMNHLCPGLVQINRAANATYSTQTRKEALAQARIEINYTLRQLSPSCPLTPDVQAADGRLKLLQNVLR